MAAQPGAGGHGRRVQHVPTACFGCGVQVYLDQVNEDKLERRRSLGRTVMTSACKMPTQLGTGQLPGAPPADLADSANHDAQPALSEAFERNSQGAAHTRPPAAQRSHVEHRRRLPL